MAATMTAEYISVQVVQVFPENFFIGLFLIRP